MLGSGSPGSGGPESKPRAYAVDSADDLSIFSLDSLYTYMYVFYTKRNTLYEYMIRLGLD